MEEAPADVKLPPAVIISSRPASPRRKRRTSTARPSTVCFSEWSRRSTSGVSESSHSRSPSVQASTRSHYQYGYGAKKKSHALRAQDLWFLIMNHVDSEQKDVSGNNLGVKSGTCVVDDLVMQRVQRQLLLLHTLCVEHDPAAEVVGALARGLTYEQLQQLQVLCDGTGHETLSDFIRVSVFNTADPFAKRPIEGPSPRAVRAPSWARTPKTQPMTPMPMPKRQLDPPLLREETIRFAGFLPVGHPLSQTAYALYQSRDGWERNTMYDQESLSNRGSFASAGSQDGAHLGDSTPPRLHRNSQQRHKQQQQQQQPSESHQTQALNQQQQQQKLYQQQGYQHQQQVYQQQQEADEQAEDVYVPLWVDVQRRWSDKNHTIIRDELFNPVIVGKPLGLYSVLPDFKRKISDQKVAAEEAAAAAAAAAVKQPLPRLQIPSYTHPADVPFSLSSRGPTPNKAIQLSSRTASRGQPSTVNNPASYTMMSPSIDHARTAMNLNQGPLGPRAHPHGRPSSNSSHSMMGGFAMGQPKPSLDASTPNTSVSDRPRTLSTPEQSSERLHAHNSGTSNCRATVAHLSPDSFKLYVQSEQVHDEPHLATPFSFKTTSCKEFNVGDPIQSHTHGQLRLPSPKKRHISGNKGRPSSAALSLNGSDISQPLHQVPTLLGQLSLFRSGKSPSHLPHLLLD